MTPKEIIDRVYKHFIVEKNPPSVQFNPVRYCYRGPNGTKCAVGIFIKDEDYKPEWDGYNGKSVSQLPLPYLQEHMALFHALQVAHDTSVHMTNFVEAFKTKLETIAQLYVR